MASSKGEPQKPRSPPNLLLERGSLKADFTALKRHYYDSADTTLDGAGFAEHCEILIAAYEELGADDEFSKLSTAEIAANSPRYRRRSSTFIDGVHDVPDEKTSPLAPAQLYSTESGRLFHSGRIAIVLVGLPARGKT